MANDERQSETFIREVDEELRRDQLKALWKRFAPLIIGVCVLIVAVTAGYRGWMWWQERKAAQAGDRFMAALTEIESGDRAKGEAELAAIAAESGAGYSALARLRLAGEKAGAGDKPAALTAYDAVADDATVPQPLRDLARIRAALLALDTGDVGWREAACRAAERSREFLAPCRARGDRNRRVSGRRPAGRARRFHRNPAGCGDAAGSLDPLGTDGLADRRAARGARNRRGRFGSGSRGAACPPAESSARRTGDRSRDAPRAGSRCVRRSAHNPDALGAISAAMARHCRTTMTTTRAVPTLLTLVALTALLWRVQRDQRAKPLQGRKTSCPGSASQRCPQSVADVAGGTPSHRRRRGDGGLVAAGWQRRQRSWKCQPRQRLRQLRLARAGGGEGQQAERPAIGPAARLRRADLRLRHHAAR